MLTLLKKKSHVNAKQLVKGEHANWSSLAPGETSQLGGRSTLAVGSLKDRKADRPPCAMLSLAHAHVHALHMQGRAIRCLTPENYWSVSLFTRCVGCGSIITATTHRTASDPHSQV